ncbi:MAG TPA: hypothetical protein VHZ73_04210 [Vicinamibacterales bacterium]|jgi:hypothetical protein|nr:hypothetical protein [Vicinamibacterales bacterium]
MACLSVIAVSAQAQQIVPEPAPLVDASHEQWQVLSEPLLVDGLVYLPSGPNRFFDPNMMARTGVYRGIPIYQDRSLEPYSIVYVPIGGGQMRPYERRRAGELAGTTGSRTPSYPVEPTGTPSDEERIVASAGTTATAAPVAPPAATVVETPSASELMPLVSAARPPHEPNGIFIEFNGAKWFGSGRPVSYSTLFEQIGTYSGVPVYRLKTDHRDRVWVPVVPGGPLAPYSKH